MCRISYDNPLETGPLVATHSKGSRHRWKFNSCKTLGLHLPQGFYQFHFKHFEARTKTLSSSSVHGKLEVRTKLKPCNTPETMWDCGIHCPRTLLENGRAGFVVETPPSSKSTRFFKSCTDICIPTTPANKLELTAATSVYGVYFHMSGDSSLGQI